MKMNRFAAGLFLLAVFTAVFLGRIHHAAAQSQFDYIGPSYDGSLCPGGFTCPGGSTTATVTLPVSSGYTGSVNSVSSYTINGSSIGSISDPADLQQSEFALSNGQITSWHLTAQHLIPNQYALELFMDSLGNPGSDLAQLNISSGGVSILALYGSVDYPPSPKGIWINPFVLGLACGRPGAASCGEPIDLGSGNMFYEAKDYSTTGQNLLAFTRYYNSMGVIGFTSAVSLGANWRHSYDRYLHIINPSAIYGVTAERPDGAVISFSSSAGTYTPDTDVDYKLTVSGSTWTLTDPDDTVETYSASGANATLQSIKARTGYLQALTYSSSQLSFVSDSYGRKLNLSYSSAGLLTGVTTPDTATLAYSYLSFVSGTGSLLQKVTYNTSPATSQTYLYENVNFPAALTGITDENGIRFQSWGYDNSGRATASLLSGAVNYTSVSYDDATGNRAVLGPLGIVETYKFTNLQGIPKVTEIDRAANGTVAFASEGFAYDSNGYLRSVTDWNGNNTSYVNNSHGDPTQIVFASATANAQTTTISYDSTWAHLAKTVNSKGLNITNTYDTTQGTLLYRSATDMATQSIPFSSAGTNRIWSFTYTSTGQLHTAQLPRTDVTAKTTLAYSSTGAFLASVTDALSHTTTVNTALGGGLPTKISDPNGIVTTLAYTSRLWLSSSTMFTSSGGLTANFTYDSAGNLTKATQPDGSYLAYGYDNAHRLTSITNKLGESQGLTLDSAGNLTQALWKNASGTTMRQHSATYDALGRLATDIGGVSQTTTFGYDNNGNVIQITDPLSNITYRSVDQLNRLTKVLDPIGYVSKITYDSHNRPLTVTDPKGNATSYVYDGFGNLIQQSNPDTLTTVYHYDLDGNLVSKTDANGVVTNQSFDALDRILTRAYPADSTLNVAFTYDQTGHGDGIGRLTSLTDQTGSLSRSYEPRGLITSDVRTISSANYTTGYTYESAGRISSITYASSGWIIGYARDAAGQIAYVSATQPSHAAVNLAASVTHLPFGPVSGMTQGNGVVNTRTFDLDYRMTGIKYKSTGGGNILYLSYGYDDNNNTHTVTDNVNSSNSRTLFWDADNRFALGGAVKYDSNSNMTQFGGSTATYASNSDRITSSGIAYDSNGNVTSYGGAANQTYSKANRLNVAIVGGVVNTYRYDAFGQRLMAQISNAPPTSIEQYDLSGHMLTETNSGVETDYAYLDNMPLSAIQPGAATISALHPEKLDTPWAATDSSQALSWYGAYADYGFVIPTITTATMNLRYPGQHSDPTAYYYNMFRDYNSTDNFGRDLEADPTGIRHGLNPYLYGWQNTYKNIDPWGLICIGSGECFPDSSNTLSGEPVPPEESTPTEPIDITSSGRSGLPGIAPPVVGVPALGAPSGEQCTAPAQSTVLASYYPQNNGFVGQSTPQTLLQGQLIDRYGFENGSFASPAGTPFYLRGLPLDAETLPLSTYQVIQPFTVQGGIAAPAHGLFGGAEQYQLPADVRTLINAGYLSPVERP